MSSKGKLVVYPIRYKRCKNTVAGCLLVMGSLAAWSADAATLTPASVTFTDTRLNTPSTAATLTFTNNEPVLPITVNSVAIGGTNSGDYSVASTTCNQGTSVAAGSSCTINVVFTPKALTSGNGTRSGTVTVNSSSLQNPSVSSTLSGTSPAPVAVLSTNPATNPVSVSFGNQAVGGTSAAKVLTLTNSSINDLTGIALSANGTNLSNFAVTAGGTSPCGTTLGGNTSCTINVTFTPDSTGAKSAVANVATSNGGSPTANLTGTGVTGPAATLSTSPVTNPVGISFGDQTSGTTSSAKTITLTNTGTSDLTGISIGLTGTNPADFSQTSGCGSTLVAGAHCAISVSFIPQGVRSSSALLSVSSSDPSGSATAALSGNGVTGVPIVSLSLAQLSFNAAKKNTTSAQVLTETLTNSGTVPLSISSIGFSGTNSGDFAKVNTSTCGTSLAASASCVVNVAFTPGAVGVRSGMLVFTTNANSSPNGVSLTGTGASDSMTIPTSYGNVTLLTDQGTIDTTQTKSVNTPSAAQALSYSYPAGFFSFRVTGVTAGSDVHLTYNMPSGLLANTYVKCNSAGTACAISQSANGSADNQSVTFTVTDNGPDDADSTGGVVVDPGAPAYTAIPVFYASSTAAAASSSGAMGWETLLLLGLPGLLRLRKRRV